MRFAFALVKSFLGDLDERYCDDLNERWIIVVVGALIHLHSVEEFGSDFQRAIPASTECATADLV